MLAKLSTIELMTLGNLTATFYMITLALVIACNSVNLREAGMKVRKQQALVDALLYIELCMFIEIITVYNLTEKVCYFHTLL